MFFPDCFTESETLAEERQEVRSAQGRSGPPASPVGQRGRGQPAHAHHRGHPAGLGGAALRALAHLLVQEPAVCAAYEP